MDVSPDDLPPPSRVCRFLVWVLLGGMMGGAAGSQPWPAGLDDTPLPDLPYQQTPDSPSTDDGMPAASPGPVPVMQGFGVTTPAMRQPSGALSGKIIFTNGGHGWTADPGTSSGWRLQRGLTFGINEDYGNSDQFNLFALYCFNAGAVVVPMRPVGHQPHEVVMDQDSAGVTFTGGWSNSSDTVYFGAAGEVPYRFAGFSATETATATYCPTLPASGSYPVYSWVRHGDNRGDQLYRIRHTGGETEIRLPHHRVGNGWVYLGEYYFEGGAHAATGSVMVSNLRSTAQGSVVIADAIRFGNGMGSVDRGDGVSGYPREDESCRYWVEASLGQGQSSTLYNTSGSDEQDSWYVPPRLSVEMNRVQPGFANHSIHISFHSNAGGGRGVLGLITGTPTPNQAALAQLCGQEVNNDLSALGVPPLELAWNNRSNVTYTGGYAEISNAEFQDEMDATIIEVGFHDSEEDAKLLRDSKVRLAIAKASMQAVIRYMYTYAGGPLVFPPDPPEKLRATGNPGNSVTLSWAAPASTGGSGAATGYVLYRSTDGRGFGQPVNLGTGTGYTLSGLTPGTAYYFRIAATNAGGESFPSAVAACRIPLAGQSTRVLLVNGYDRLDRSSNLKQTLTAKAWVPPGQTGTAERVLPLRSNASDYLVPHGQAVSAHGFAFDSATQASVADGTAALAPYPILVWAAGQQSTAGETFSTAGQSRLAAFRNAGGHLLVSGSEIGWDLDRDTGPTAADRSFYNTHLKADLNGNANDNANSYTATPAAGGIFAGRAAAPFDDGSLGGYRVQTPDLLTPFGTGTQAALSYQGVTPGAAAIQYDGRAGGGRVVYLGFPFETIGSATRRSEYMADVLDWFTTGADSADPDLDRRNNLVEYATGSDPLVPDSAPPLEVEVLPGSLAVRFYRNPQAAGTVLKIQTAENPSGSWTDVARSTAGAPLVLLVPGWTLQETGSPARPLVQLTEFPFTAGRRFFRLGIVRF